jgi:hypothetical protein
LERRIEEKRIEIVKQLKILRRRLECDDNSQLLVWIIASALACAPRPLRHHSLYGGSGLPIPRRGEAADFGLDTAHSSGGNQEHHNFHARQRRSMLLTYRSRWIGSDRFPFHSGSFGETTPVGRSGSQQNGCSHKTSAAGENAANRT